MGRPSLFAPYRDEIEALWLMRISDKEIVRRIGVGSPVSLAKYRRDHGLIRKNGARLGEATSSILHMRVNNATIAKLKAYSGAHKVTILTGARTALEVGSRLLSLPSVKLKAVLTLLDVAEIELP